MRHLKYISFIICLFQLSIVNGQKYASGRVSEVVAAERYSTRESVIQTSVYTQFVIADQPFTIIDDISVDFTGSRLIAYYDSSGTWAPAGIYLADSCFGCISNLFTIYGDDTSTADVKEGYAIGEDLKFGLWYGEESCFIDELSLNLRSSMVTFDNAGADTITGVYGQHISVEYPVSNECNNSGFLTPEISGDTRDIFFNSGNLDTSTIEDSLIIDMQTGVIDLGRSDFGDYEIMASTKTCLDTAQIMVSVDPDLQSGASVEVSNVSCDDELGQAELMINNALSNNFTFYFSLVKIEANSLIIDSDDSLSGGRLFQDLEVGSYQMELGINQRNCSDVFVFSVDKDTCDSIPDYTDLASGDAILSLTHNPNYDFINAPCDKGLKIVNRYGNVIRELPRGEKVWDGRDSNGDFVNVGLYIIYCRDERLGEVTVLP